MNTYFKRFLLFYLPVFIVFVNCTQCTKSVDAQLKEIAQQTNEKCPKQLDNWTRLDSCKVYSGFRYRYFQTIQNVIVSDTTLFKKQLTPQIVSTIKVNPDLRFFRDNNVTMEYQYNNEAKEYIFSIIVMPEEYKKE